MVMVPAFSLSETLSVGFAYNFHSAGDSIKTKINTIGIDLTANSIFNDETNNVGLFVHGLIGFPLNLKTTYGKIERNMYSALLKVGLAIGPSYRIKFDESNELVIGGGFNFDMLVAKNKEETASSLDIYLGVQFIESYRRMLSDSLYLGITLAETLNFVDFQRFNPGSFKNTRGCFAFDFTATAAIGFRFK